MSKSRFKNPIVLIKSDNKNDNYIMTKTYSFNYNQGNFRWHYLKTTKFYTCSPIYPLIATIYSISNDYRYINLLKKSKRLISSTLDYLSDKDYHWDMRDLIDTEYHDDNLYVKGEIQLDE